jgi:cell division protein FtsA
VSARRKKKGGAFITGVDIGTSKICVAVTEITDDGIDVLSLSSAPSGGIRKGVVANVDEATVAIRRAMASAREESGIPVREAIVSISGMHIETAVESASVAISGRTVSEMDIESVVDAVGSRPVAPGREIIHVLPVDFIVDGSMGIKDPFGIPGSRLEVKANVITAGAEPLQRLIISCEKSGLQISDFAIQSIAAAESVLSAEERDMGTALVDIGAGTTDIAMFRDGWLLRSAVIGVGGNHFTNDLSVGLGIPFQEAERIKKQFGNLAGTFGPAGAGDDAIDVIGVYGEVKKVSGRLACEILHMRGEELLQSIVSEIAQIEGRDAITGAVFSGGCVLMPNFERVAEGILSMPVRVGKPDLAPKHIYQSAPSLPFATGLKEEFNGPEYAAVIGLVLYGANSMAAAAGETGEGVLTKMTGFIKNIMGRKK